ncbi:NAD(P)-dependent oxidoreductase [Micromonospora sp. HNM0581]|uniref:NAD-dependent epimerase/dehydratase family protein n=1 Tax=Micromonospora sp. HNM0581 TaxID=2716341 RepID=UPI00146A23AB|nr:NAD(P)-dependent oxidoreductase [Micromonospora sp. HNM0581]
MSTAVAVLGATGGVGQHVCSAFRASGDHVLGIARRPSVAGSALRLDLAEAAPGQLAAALTAHRTEIVVNATGGWVLSAEAMHLAHVQIVERLVAASTLMPDPPRIVHIGTIHEYGPVPAGTLIDESRTPEPQTGYARTKLAGSQALLNATAAGTARGVVLRAVNVCGPGTTSASFLGAVLDRIRDVRPGDRVPMTIADARRDYLDVRDLTDAVVRAARAPESTVGQVINVGRGEAVAMRQLVDWLLAAAGLPPDTIDEQGAAVQSKGGDWTRADNRRAARLLGWQPRTALDASLRDMWHDAARRYSEA